MSLTGAMQRTGEDEKHEPVHNQHGPEHGNVEDLEPAAEEGNGNSAGGRMPKLELGKAADEGPELLVLLGGEGTDRAVLHFRVERITRGVELGREEGEEEVEKVDAEGVGDNVPALCDEHPHEEEKQGDAGANPSVRDIGRRLIEECLVLLKGPNCVSQHDSSKEARAVNALSGACCSVQ